MHVSVGDPLPPEDWGDHAAEVAIERLYHSESRRLARFFARRVAHDDVVDLVQESFRRLIGVSANGRSWLNNPEAYLQTVAGNLLRDRSRSAWQKAAHVRADYEEETIIGPDPQAALEDRDLLARIDAAMLKLKPKTREIFQLHRLDGLSYAEIADRMGMSVKGVEYQLAKALDELRRRVDRR